MSIASELNNLEGNIEDSYDAVNDMGGVIPAQRNMDNLDQAIRTIPQNQGTTYTAGNGIDITNDVISIDDTVVAELSDLPGVMTGASSSTAGTSGLAPAPAAGDDTKYLKGDGTWATVQSGTEVKKFYIDNDYIFRAGTVNQEILDAPGGNAVSDATLFAAMKDGLVMIIANSDGTDYESAIATNAWMDSGVLKFTIYGSSSVDSSIDAMQVVSTGGGYYDFDGYDIVPKNGTLTIQHNGTNVQTFSANSSTNKTANIETIWADDIEATTPVPAVETAMIADGAVTSAKIADGTIATGDIANGAVTSAKVAAPVNDTWANFMTLESGYSAYYYGNGVYQLGKITIVNLVIKKESGYFPQSGQVMVATIKTGYRPTANINTYAGFGGEWSVSGAGYCYLSHSTGQISVRTEGASDNFVRINIAYVAD